MYLSPRDPLITHYGNNTNNIIYIVSLQSDIFNLQALYRCHVLFGIYVSCALHLYWRLYHICKNNCVFLPVPILVEIPQDCQKARLQAIVPFPVAVIRTVLFIIYFRNI